MNFLNKVSHLEESLEGSSKNNESSEANKAESLAGSESKSGNESGTSNLLGFAEELGKTFFKKGTENDVKNEFNKMDKGKTGFITFENALKLLAMFNGNFDTQAILNFKNKFSGSGSGSSGGSKIGLKDIMSFFKK